MRARRSGSFSSASACASTVAAEAYRPDIARPSARTNRSSGSDDGGASIPGSNASVVLASTARRLASPQPGWCTGSSGKPRPRPSSSISCTFTKRRNARFSSVGPTPSSESKSVSTPPSPWKADER